jgi:uncharacterized membrane protein YhaH (DUF805 family)
MLSLRRLVRFWAKLDAPVDRVPYFLNGFGLAVVKYVGDVSLIWLLTGSFWKPTDYLYTTHSLYLTKLGASEDLIPALVFWALPFLWIGIILTFRRLMDAGLSPWWALAFFVPFLNYILMGALCLIPISLRSVPSEAALEKPGGKRLRSAVLGIVAGVFFALMVLAAAILLNGEYGYTLFFGAPFGMSALSAFLFNRGYEGTFKETFQVCILTLLCVAGVLVLFAYEGLLCIAMAIPVGLVVSLLGAVTGRAMARMGQRVLPSVMSMMVLLPIFAALEPPNVSGIVVQEVRSSVVIDAQSEVVWPHVIAFAPIPEPKDLLFRMGIAYPKYARIDGVGVGAVRYCVFSTGPFVEPITDWEPGKRLGFDVTSSPDPLRELSLYANLSPPHLHGYLRSLRGEFRLVALPGGHTRLEGSTWYEIRMEPGAYWRIWSDYLIHRIHDRVLEHIKAEVENSSRGQESSEYRP